MLPFWTSSPLTRQRTRTPASGSHSSGVTRTGPERGGAVEGLALEPLQGAALPVAHGDVVRHGVAGDRGRGFLRRGVLERGADDDRQFRFPVQPGAVPGGVDDVAVADQGVRVLGEQRGVLRQLPAHFRDVVRVVQAAADDLGRARQHGGEPGVADRDGLVRTALPAASAAACCLLPPAGPSQQFTEVPRGQEHETVPRLHGGAGGGATPGVAGCRNDGRKAHDFFTSGSTAEPAPLPVPVTCPLCHPPRGMSTFLRSSHMLKLTRIHRFG